MSHSTDLLVEMARRLYQKNLLAAADGNLSFLREDDLVSITPSGKAKAFLKNDEMSFMDLRGNNIQGTPSSEKWMHLRVYQSQKKAKAVIHAHPPAAIAWSIAHPGLKELPTDALPELILSVGKIPIVPYCRPGGQEIADILEPYLKESRALILARHGVLCWGENLEEAWRGVERIEHAAEILARAQMMGGLSFLERDELNVLRRLKEQRGDSVL